ncbi:putative uncharacterized protein DDB_G0282133 [Rhopalosiphum maidis]|uniref:putative uncharacterized protein DDB_G0282133 n=1 Tax=Rhopalosiphum maidis TaxID=43146 RepID=UPI000EFEB56A|nr:putative uncharacterized protein DDB_G0282133 [Rhopalosiphum maidis]
MSDHFDHYKRPPSRDNSVDRYSRAASRLSGGSRQSSVEKSQNQQQQQQRRGDDRLPSSSSSAADKSFNGAAGFTTASAAGAKQNISSSAATHRQPPPFEEIILRQRNLGQEIVPSPIGQPKRTESLYVNPNTARKETKPKVSTTFIRRTSRSNSLDSDDGHNCYGGSGGSGGSDHIYGNRRVPDINIIRNFVSMPLHDGRASVDSDDRASSADYAIRDISGFRTNDNTGDSRIIRGIDNGRAIMGSVDSSPIRRSSDGRISRISNYGHASRDGGDSRSRSGSSDDYAIRASFDVRASRRSEVGRYSRDRSDGRSRSGSSDDYYNMLNGESRFSRGRGDGRLNSRCFEVRFRSNSGDNYARSNVESYTSGDSSGTCPSGDNSGIRTSGNRSGTRPSGDNSCIRPSRDNSCIRPSRDNSCIRPSGDSSGTRPSRSGLRVRFSDEVSSSDDHNCRGGDLDRGQDQIRSGRHNSHLNSDNSNQIRTRDSVDRETRNMDNIQIYSRGNYGNNADYASGSGSIDENADSVIHNFTGINSRFDGYGNGGVCSRSESYFSNGIREVSVIHSRSSVLDIDDDHIICNICDNGGADGNIGAHGNYGNNNGRRGNISIHSSSGGDSGQVSDYDYGGEYNYEREYNRGGRYDYEDDESSESNDEGAIGGGRIPRLLPSRPSNHKMVWFKTYLNNNKHNFVLYKH